MGIGTSIFLIAVGAIIRYGITADVEGVDLDVVGLVLLIVGAVGLLISLLWMFIWADRTRGARGPAVVRERDAVVEPEPVVRDRVVERERL